MEHLQNELKEVKKQVEFTRLQELKVENENLIQENTRLKTIIDEN